MIKRTLIVVSFCLAFTSLLFGGNEQGGFGSAVNSMQSTKASVLLTNGLNEFVTLGSNSNFYTETEQSETIYLTIPNEELLIIQSDFDSGLISTLSLINFGIPGEWRPVPQAEIIE